MYHHPWYVKNWKNCLRLVRNLLQLRVLARRRRQGHWRRAARWQPLLPWEAAEQNGAHLQDELSLSKYLYFLTSTRAATNDPDRSRCGKGVTRRFPARGWVHRKA